jgi:hypothetical protein
MKPVADLTRAGFIARLTYRPGKMNQHPTLKSLRHDTNTTLVKTRIANKLNQTTDYHYAASKEREGGLPPALLKNTISDEEVKLIREMINLFTQLLIY